MISSVGEPREGISGAAFYISLLKLYYSQSCLNIGENIDARTLIKVTR